MRRPRHLALATSLLALLAGLGFAPGADGEPAANSPAVSYSSFVCWDYTLLPKLGAWKETESVIATTLAEAYPGLQKLTREENGSPGQLKDFLHQLPDAPGRIDVVYLAAHQSASGRWYFPDRSIADWGTLMTGLPDLRNPQRIVLLDCCYAQAADQWPGWRQKVAPACIYAAPADQLTPDLMVFWRRPVDCGVLFPGATLWLRAHHLTSSDERLSFFGLVWLEAWTQQPSPPRTLAGWRALGQAMTQIAAQVSAQVRARYASTISASFAP